MDGDWAQEIRALLEVIREDIGDIKIVQAEQALTLRDHIRRTELNEAALEAQKKELAPLKTHVAVWGYVGKILAGAVLAAMIGTVVKLLS